MDNKVDEAGLNEQPPAYNTAAAYNQYPQSGYPLQQDQYGGPASAPPGYTNTWQPDVAQQGIIIAQPGTYQPAPIVRNMMINPPPDHMIFNIVMTLCCCWPIGIFAIVKSLACRDAINRGDEAQAVILSREARRIGYWTLGIGTITMVVCVILIVLVYAVYLPDMMD